MLVLSRKESERILFPTLGITVEVLRIQGNTTRIGIDAPPEIPILRHELADLKSIAFSTDNEAKSKLVGLVHAIRQRLESASVVLNGLHRHLDETGDLEAQQAILQLFGQLRSLEEEADDAIEKEDACLARALLVDADADQRQLLASYLRLRGIETTTAKDGQDALDYLSLHAAPDVVLFDMLLPRCDGQCLVSSLRRDAKMNRVKLFAVSRTNPSLLGVASGPQGVDRWFPKPVDPEHLVDGIAESLGFSATAV